jgi:hypothetical protein
MMPLKFKPLRKAVANPPLFGRPGSKVTPDAKTKPSAPNSEAVA